MIGIGRKERVEYPRNKTVVVGFFERGGKSLQVRFGVGEYIQEEIQGRKEESFRVKWEDGRVDEFPVPPFEDIFLRRDGGNVVFYYVQVPGVAIPIAGPTNAVKRLEFDDREEAERFIQRLRMHNPNIDVKLVEKPKNGKYVVEFPVITFDIDKDIPLRESYSKAVMRLFHKYWKKSWWEKFGNAVVTIGSVVILLLAAIFGFQFVQKSYEHAEKVFSNAFAALEKTATSLENVAAELNDTTYYLGKLLEMRVARTSPGAVTNPPPG